MVDSEEEDQFHSPEAPRRLIIEKGFRNMYRELLELKNTLKDANDLDYLSSSLSDEVFEVKQELSEFQRHISTHTKLLQNAHAVRNKLHQLIKANKSESCSKVEDQHLLEFDVLQGSEKSALPSTKTMLVNRLTEVNQQPSESKKAALALLRLGNVTLAYQTFLESYEAYLKQQIASFLLTRPYFFQRLSNLVFSTILHTFKEFDEVFGPEYSDKVVQWAKGQLEYLFGVITENMPPYLSATCLFVQASLNHSSALELKGLNLTEFVLELLHPLVEDAFELTFLNAKEAVLALDGTDEMKFIHLVKEIVEQLTHLTILHFGGNLLSIISELFYEYVKVLIEASNDNLEDIPFKAETDSQKIALLRAAFSIAEELLPMAVLPIWNVLSERNEAGNEGADSIVLRDWTHQLRGYALQLRDHIYLQFASNLIYTRDDKKAILEAQIYLGVQPGVSLPSLPFQAFFGRLVNIAAVATKSLSGRQELWKRLLAKLTETLLIWSYSENFWDDLERGPLTPNGLQQLVLDVHFTVEIARHLRFSDRQISNRASYITERASKAFSAQGIDPASFLPEKDWFVTTAKVAIMSLLNN